MTKLRSIAEEQFSWTDFCSKSETEFRGRTLGWRFPPPAQSSLNFGKRGSTIVKKYLQGWCGVFADTKWLRHVFLRLFLTASSSPHESLECINPQFKQTTVSGNRKIAQFSMLWAVLHSLNMLKM
jgi:hypothetical protein